MKKRHLFLSFDYRSIKIDPAIDVLRDSNHVDVVILSRRQIRHLRWTLWRLKARTYDAVMIDLPFKHTYKQYRALRRLPRLLTYEEDACQDRIPNSKWFGQFSTCYRKIPGIRVLVSGYQTAGHLRSQGINTGFAHKGYNDRLLYPEERTSRDIEVGFVGRVRSNVYRERKELIEQATEALGCQTFRTETLDEYRHMLNRIQFFFSADRGLGEYMAKNFEAMACGCILVAWRQGGNEEEFLGLKDGVNCLLYSSIEEAKDKIMTVKGDPGKVRAIQDNGIALARERYTHTRLGQVLRDALSGETG